VQHAQQAGCDGEDDDDEQEEEEDEEELSTTPQFELILGEDGTVRAQAFRTACGLNVSGAGRSTANYAVGVPSNSAAWLHSTYGSLPMCPARCMSTASVR
jgi:hypothetical protein